MRTGLVFERAIRAAMHGPWPRVAAGLAMLLLAVSTACFADDGSTSQIEAPTHRQIRLLKPKVDGQELTLHTLTTDADGNLYVALGGDTVAMSMGESDGLD